MQVKFRHFRRGNEFVIPEAWIRQQTLFELHILTERVAQTHGNTALDLSLESGSIDYPADVLRRSDLVDRYLAGPGVYGDLCNMYCMRISRRHIRNMIRSFRLTIRFIVIRHHDELGFGLEVHFTQQFFQLEHD